jgi:hypothetical protein
MERQSSVVFQPFTAEERWFAEQKRHHARMERYAERQAHALERLADRLAPEVLWEPTPPTGPGT